MTSHRIVIPGQPIAFARPGVTDDGRRYSPKRYKEWRDDAETLIALTRRGVTFDGPVHVEVFVYPDGVVASFHGSTPDVRPSSVTGDLDNYVKAILDAAQSAHLIADDKQVQRISAYFINDEPLPSMTP